MFLRAIFPIILFLFPLTFWGHGSDPTKGSYWVALKTENKYERSKIVNLGISIENMVDDRSYAFVRENQIEILQRNNIKIEKKLPAELFLRKDFPQQDAIYHNYSELETELSKLATTYAHFISKFSIGKSSEGREIWAIRFNPDALELKEVSAKPAIVLMGGHHAREHLSVELPLLLAKYLAEKNGSDPLITELLRTREIFIIPQVNPDGSEFDISTGQYKMWRKNRTRNPNTTCMGVDLNRNYGFAWGTGGSSQDPCSDIFMGSNAFSEPESVAIKKFVESKANLKVLLSFHTFSELILYPWGHSYNPVPNTLDQSAYETMAKTMAQWNGYTPQQASDLYIASGDTTDWSYGTLGIFSFTFELSPSQWGGGGFYPGAQAIQKTFQANLKPILYLIDLADDPHRSFIARHTTLFYGE